MTKSIIGFLGLGKLGLPCALAIESKGHRVMGWDICETTRGYITDRAIPYREADIQPLLDDTAIELRKLPEMIAMCDIIFVPIQTPHMEAYEGKTRVPFRREEFDYTALKAGLSQIADEAARQERNVVVSVISTVLPGAIDREIRPLLNSFVKLCYNPFFIAMGTCVADFLHPEFVLLGVDDDDAADKVGAFYATITDAAVRRMSIASAECTKVMYNTAITAKITITNAIGRLCHESLGANCDDVMAALRASTARIMSPAYTKVGMGDGGGCHPRDNIALSAVCRAKGWGYDPWGDLMNWRDGYQGWLAWLMIETGLPMVILGYTFKPETNLSTGSPALLVQSVISQLGRSAVLADPEIDGTCDCLVMCSPHCYLIGCKHRVFAEYRFPPGSVVIDPHRYILDQDGVEVIRIGENGPSYCRG